MKLYISYFCIYLDRIFKGFVQNCTKGLIKELNLTHYEEIVQSLQREDSWFSQWRKVKVAKKVIGFFARVRKTEKEEFGKEK